MSIQGNITPASIKAGFGGYHLPKASETVLGGIKVGENLEIDNEGKLKAIQQFKVLNFDGEELNIEDIEDGSYIIGTSGVLVNSYYAALEMETGAIFIKNSYGAAYIRGTGNYWLIIDAEDWNTSYCVTQPELETEISEAIEPISTTVENKKNKLTIKTLVDNERIKPDIYAYKNTGMGVPSVKVQIDNTFKNTKGAEALLTFNSGAIPTTFTVGGTNPVYFSGDDCDEFGIFTPTQEKVYELRFISTYSGVFCRVFSYPDMGQV